MCQELIVNSIIEESIVDGPGIRFVVFVQGCPHNCLGCHNPLTHSFKGGEKMDIDYIYNKIIKNPLISGITFSGGEPFCQAEHLRLLAQKIKATTSLEIAIYTGFTFENLIALNDNEQMKLLSLIDILIDGPFKKEEKDLNLLFKGSKNQRILNVAKSLKSNKAILTTNNNWVIK